MGKRLKHSAVWRKPHSAPVVQRPPLALTPCPSKPCSVIHLKLETGGEGGGVDGGGEWAGHEGEWMSQGQRQSGELGWKQTNEFFRSLPAPDRWHHLAVLSIHLTHHPPPPPPQPTNPSSSSPPIFLSSHLHRREKKKQGKKCLFLNRPLNLFGLAIIGHLHGEHSEVSAITTGL